MTRFLFRLLSAGYILGIFFFADSSVVSDLAPFNPYSLLHIPLYGILTVLLVFAFVPPKSQFTRATRLIFPGAIALVVAVADEIHQAYIPGRNASALDVFLDALGIALCLIILWRLQ